MDEKRCRELVKCRAVSMDPAAHSALEFLPCESCGTWVNDYELHHRRFRSRGGLWAPSNILLLCRACHLAATEERPWATFDGLNVTSHEVPSEVPVVLWHRSVRVFLTDDGGITSVLTKTDNAGSV